ncbi:proline-rich protein 27 isoform 1 precursor [Mus musculus]|uniref:4930432K09Rik protein n=1 Tax=Mus musculus TaxID=10090 RepID=Q3SYJ2_MOUSE|nr:proline-rich protein 27 isoform 1 precursor [Mus musculus]AAI03788.1 4930432K09Rik protein [Mus musculus]|eukprot:NP_001157023.1 proline-rich protein 27 isoform 1 precursor [Mus musculus]
MKLLLWACIMCVAFAKRRRYPFIHKKSPSSTEEDYFGNRYPLNPSLNIPFGLWNDNLPPFLLPPFNTQQGNTITKFPGSSELEKGLSLYPWIATPSKLRYVYQSLNYPADAPLNGPPVAPLPPPKHFPPRPYPFVIPPKISVISPVRPEPVAVPAMPAEGEGLVPEFPVDKPILGLPQAVKLGTPVPPSGPKPLAPEPAPSPFGAPEPAPVQFGAPEPAPHQLEAAVPDASRLMAPEPAVPLSVGAQSLAESPAGLSPENKPTSGEPAATQSLPALPAAGLAVEAKLPAAESAAGRPPPAELMASQSVVGKLITAEPTEAKPQVLEPVEAKSASQEAQPFFYQVPMNKPKEI